MSQKSLLLREAKERVDAIDGLGRRILTAPPSSPILQECAVRYRDELRKILRSLELLSAQISDCATENAMQIRLLREHILRELGQVEERGKSYPAVPCSDKQAEEIARMIQSYRQKYPERSASLDPDKSRYSIPSRRALALLITILYHSTSEITDQTIADRSGYNASAVYQDLTDKSNSCIRDILESNGYVLHRLGREHPETLAQYCLSKTNCVH